MNWNHLKPNVLSRLDQAGVKGPAAKVILTFERRRNTLHNMLNRCSWEAMTNTKAYDDARDALDSLNNGGHYRPEEAPYWEEWVSFCEASGLIPTANLGDHLC